MKNIEVKKFNVIKGFTLAETLITLTILGVVAAITIPALINKYNESANRTKLKKAMAAYEKALNQMIIDNDIKGVITATEGFGIGECDISSKYFKAVEILNENNCRFKTADKIGYDITDITHPIFFLSDDYKTTDLETESTGLRALAKDTDNKDVFGGVGNIQDGIVRINDKGAATGDDATILNKSYAFANNETVNKDKYNGISDWQILLNNNPYAGSCGDDIGSDIYCEMDLECRSCTDRNGIIWDNNGNSIKIENNNNDVRIDMYDESPLGGQCADFSITTGKCYACSNSENLCKAVGYSNCSEIEDEEGYVCTK